MATPSDTPEPDRQTTAIDRDLDHLEELVGLLGWSTNPLEHIDGEVTLSFLQVEDADEFFATVTAEPSDDPRSLYQAVVNSWFDHQPHSWSQEERQHNWWSGTFILDDVERSRADDGRPEPWLEIGFIFPEAHLESVTERLRGLFDA